MLHENVGKHGCLEILIIMIDENSFYSSLMNGLTD